MHLLNISSERKGEALLALGAVVWGFFPVALIFSYRFVEPLTSLAWSTVCAAFFFGCMITVRRRWNEVFNREAMRDAFFVAIFLGVLLYAFYYTGLEYTSAGNASIVSKLEILFSYLFFHVWRKDALSRVHTLGALLMILGAGIILWPNFSELRKGDLLIVAAVMCGPFGNFFAQRARKLVCTEVVLFVRYVISIPFLFLLAMYFKQTVISEQVVSYFPLLALFGLLFFGINKILWMEGIHRVSVTKACAISCVTPLVTLFVAFVFLHEAPAVPQLLSLIPLTAGLILLGMNRKETR